MHLENLGALQYLAGQTYILTIHSGRFKLQEHIDLPLMTPTPAPCAFAPFQKAGKAHVCALEVMLRG